MNIDNVIPLYDLLEGSLYGWWQRIIIIGGLVVVLGVILWYNLKEKVRLNMKVKSYCPYCKKTLDIELENDKLKEIIMKEEKSKGFHKGEYQK